MLQPDDQFTDQANISTTAQTWPLIPDLQWIGLIVLFVLWCYHRGTEAVLNGGHSAFQTNRALLSFSWLMNPFQSLVNAIPNNHCVQ